MKTDIQYGTKFNLQSPVQKKFFSSEVFRKVISIPECLVIKNKIVKTDNKCNKMPWKNGRKEKGKLISKIKRVPIPYNS